MHDESHQQDERAGDGSQLPAVIKRPRRRRGSGWRAHVPSVSGGTCWWTQVHRRSVNAYRRHRRSASTPSAWQQVSDNFDQCGLGPQRPLAERERFLRQFRSRQRGGEHHGFGAMLSDPDSPTLTSLVVTDTNPFDGTDEVLDATVTGTSISKSYLNGALTLSGVDLIADYNTVLHTVTFNNTATTPYAGEDRIVTFVAYDGISSSNVATTRVSDPPARSSSSQLVRSSLSSASPCRTLCRQSRGGNLRPALPWKTLRHRRPTRARRAWFARQRGGRDGQRGERHVEFVAGASQNTVIANGRSYPFPVGQVTAFRFDGGGGNDTAKLTASGIAALAETANSTPTPPPCRESGTRSK